MVSDMDRNTRRRTKHILLGLLVVALVLYLKGFTLFGASSNKEILPEYYKLPHDHKQADNSLVDQGLKEGYDEERDLDLEDLGDISVDEDELMEMNNEMLAERLAEVKKGCQALDRPPSDSLDDLENPLSEFFISTKHSYIYCMVRKAGTKFWTNTLADLESIEGGEGEKEFPNEKSMRFVFVRDPYDRLFSAYLDVINLPDTGAWTESAEEIIQTVRKKPKMGSSGTNHYLTFTEFLEYIVQLSEDGTYIDKHFAPMHQLCDPCKMRFDFIGTIETFGIDAFFIAKKVAESSKTLGNKMFAEFQYFNKHQLIGEIEPQIYSFFTRISETRELQNDKYTLLLRYWRILQMRGHISKKLYMPIAKERASDINYEDFITLVKAATAKSIKGKGIKAQRQEAMAQAYQSVPPAILEKIHKYVEIDCWLFGYDDRPEDLYNREVTLSKNSFNYFEGI